MPQADQPKGAVKVDDGPPRVLALRSGVHRYQLADNLDADERHIARLWKLTEAEVGTIRILDFDTDGRADRRLAPPRRPVLEAVGDSITVGFGSAASSTQCEDHVAFSDSYNSYTAIAARELGLSYRAIAYSGKGLTRNYNPAELETLPALYDRTLPLDPHPAGRANGLPAADVVVVNLGTNDFMRGVPDPSAFSTALDQFLRAVRRRNRSARIVLALGPMLADDYPAPQARSTLRGWLIATANRHRAGGDSRVSFLEFWIDPTEGLGCDFHPSLKTHARMARELAAHVSEVRRATP